MLVIYNAPSNYVLTHASIFGFYNGLCTVSYLQFIEDIGDVITDRFTADVQLIGNILVVFALSNQG